MAAICYIDPKLSTYSVWCLRTTQKIEQIHLDLEEARETCQAANGWSCNDCVARHFCGGAPETAPAYHVGQAGAAPS